MHSGKCYLLEVIVKVFQDGKQLSSTLFLWGKKRLHVRIVIYFTGPPTALALVSYEYKPTLQKKWYKGIQYPSNCFCFATFRRGFNSFNEFRIRYVRLDSVHILLCVQKPLSRKGYHPLGVSKHIWHITLYVHTHFTYQYWGEMPCGKSNVYTHWRSTCSTMRWDILIML